MKRRELLKVQSTLPVIALTSGCALLEPSGSRIRCDQIDVPDTATASFEMDVSNAQAQPHTVEVRFYERPSGQFYCGASIDVAANPEPGLRAVREFTLEMGQYGVLVRLEDGRTDWTYWTVDEEGRTLYVTIENNDFAIGGAQLLD